MIFKKFNDIKDYDTLTARELYDLNYFETEAIEKCGEGCIVYLVAANFNKTGNNKIIFFYPDGKEYHGRIMTGGEQGVQIFDSYKYDEMKYLKNDMKWICGTKTEKAFNEKIKNPPSRYLRDMRKKEDTQK